MFAADIFFLYPPGYSGNYLQWILNVSEKDLSADTIRDPLLPDGTTHGFVRKPTHIGLSRLVQWMLKNKPQQHKTYIVNAFQNPTAWIQQAPYAASFLLHAFPDCNLVNIYADTDDEVKYGALNCYTKWPTFFDANKFCQNYEFDVWGATGQPTLTDRNHFYNNWRKDFPVNRKAFNEEFAYNVRVTQEWYTSRNNLQPWEVNEEEYVHYAIPPVEKILHVSLAEILKDTFLTDTFIPWAESRNIGTFDWAHAVNYHSTYVQAQKNSAWFTSISQFRNSKIVDDFLLSNSLSQAFLLEELGSDLADIIGWEGMTTEQILTHFNYLINTSSDQMR